MVSLKSPHGEPSLERSESVRTAVKGGSSVQAAFKSERVMISPIATQYIFETFPEKRIFPSLDRSSYKLLTENRIDSSQNRKQTINMGREEVPLRAWFPDPKSICVGQWSI